MQVRGGSSFPRKYWCTSQIFKKLHLSDIVIHSYAWLLQACPAPLSVSFRANWRAAAGPKHVREGSAFPRYCWKYFSDLTSCISQIVSYGCSNHALPPSYTEQTGAQALVQSRSGAQAATNQKPPIWSRQVDGLANERTGAVMQLRRGWLWIAIWSRPISCPLYKSKKL